jgi:acyl-CoA reductase-like NAD-dependent aldehyde dehydrogenase
MMNGVTAEDWLIRRAFMTSEWTPTQSKTRAANQQQLYIDGEWIDGDGHFAVASPWDGAIEGVVASATRQQVDDAITAAHRHLAKPLPLVERAEMLERSAALVGARAEEFARGISAESGKPMTAARSEVTRAIDTLQLAGEEARQIRGSTVPVDAVRAGIGLFAFERPGPLGVVAAITPFNFPLNLVCHKLGPALAAGCPVVIKPSEKTPLTAGRLVEVFAEAGVPRGMVNLITGDPMLIVSALLEDDRIAAVNFTGSAEIGWSLKERSPRKHHVLELGSNTALVVARDANLDAAAEAAVSSGFAFSGQTCLSVQRCFVDASVADDFLDRLASRAAALPVGDPSLDTTAIGPLITEESQSRVASWVDEAIEQGADIVTGYKLKNGVMPATVLDNVNPGSKVLREEVFGPVVSVCRVADISEALTRVNDSRFGLNTAIFTRDLDLGLSFAARAEAGSVLINITPSFRADNMPYGGVKDSGQGREGISYAINEMTERKLIVMPASGQLGMPQNM